PQRSVQALGDIIEAERGRLWLENRATGTFELAAAWHMQDRGADLAADDALVRFMRETRWVVDTREYLGDPEKYSNMLPAESPHLLEPTIFVPLIHASALIGIVALVCPPGLGALGYEDHDLLKTAGRQVAIFLEQQ